MCTKRRDVRCYKILGARVKTLVARLLQNRSTKNYLSSIRFTWKLLLLIAIQRTSVLKWDRDWKFRLRSGPGGIGIGNFDLGRDRAGSGLEISTQVGIGI